MFENDELSIDCATCIGAGTTACSDCIVTILLANDDGPIAYVPIQLTEVPPLPTPEEVAIEMFTRAGLITSPVEFIPLEMFESSAVPVGVRRHAPA